MTARILDGKALAARIRDEIAGKIATLGFRPGLAVVIVGNDPASAVYVRNKEQAAGAAGLAARTIALAANTSEAALLGLISELNADPATDGILVQLPLPAHIRAQLVIEAIDPAKDVDGFHPLNAGRLALGMPAIVPCTPRGIMRLLALSGHALPGARAAVLGRSAIVGRPAAALLTAADATVTLLHSRSRDVAAECRRAEIVIAAVGRAEMVRGDWIAEGAVVIDVGIHRGADGKLRGDVAFDECAARAGAITKVPGGVGPMTIASLLENTLEAALSRRARPG